MGHHSGGGDTELRARQLVKALRDLASSATEASLAHVCRLSKDSILGVVDSVTKMLAESPVDPERIHAIGRVLAGEACDREVVKLGIALMGIVKGGEDSEMLAVLGTHEEFTLFCAVAISRQMADHERPIWDLAKRVDGWGRIQLVERLADTEDPEIRAWLLREGFRNSVMYEYLAYTCATAGRLMDALRVHVPDDALLVGASEIFSALATGGPAQDLSDYADAEAAVSAWLEHIERRPLALEYVEALDALSDRSELSSELKRRLVNLRDGQPARTVVEAGLEAHDAATFGRADVAARARGIDTRGQHAARLRQRSDNAGYHLFRLIEDVDVGSIDEALEIAGGLIDLEKVASGPAKQLGMGPGFEGHRLLDTVVQGLARFPGKGAQFVLAALRSPVTRNRNMALRALAAWRSDQWPAELRTAVEEAAKVEPDDDVRERFERVLEGGLYE
jgi:hypothetical protein